MTIEAEDKHDFKDRLAEITVPTLVIAGDQDPFYSETLFHETAEGIPNARFIWLLKWFFQSSIFVIIPPEIGGVILRYVDYPGTTDPSAVRAFVMGTLLIYNGSIAFALTGLFMASAGYAILATGAPPKWTGWVACASAILCLVAIPSMYVGAVDTNGFYNVAGWGPAIVANVLPLIWFFIASISMIRKREAVVQK